MDMFFSLLILGFCFFNTAFADISNQNASFKDEYNRTVILHGLNEINKEPPYSPDSIGFDIKSIQFFKKYGFNLVRLGVYWAAIEPRPHDYDTKYLFRIKQTIDLLRQNGIYTLIDFHQDGYSAKYNSGLGAPIWAAVSTPDKGIMPGFPVNLFGGNYGISLATDQDFELFWQNHTGPRGEPLQKSYNDMVKVVTNYFLNTPGIIGYEIMNEPFPGLAWEACYNSQEKFRVGCNRFDQDVLSVFYSDVVNSIRSIDNKRIIFYEPNVFFGVGAPSFVIAPRDNNLGFSFHNYYNENPKQVFDYTEQHVVTTASVPLMTEFGAAVTNSDQMNQIVELADQYQLSWTEWAFTNNPVYKFAHAKGVPDDPREQGIVYDAKLPLEGDNVKWDRLYILSRVYPQVVAGKIKQYEFNAATKIFTLTYDINDSMGKTISTSSYTDIVIPDFIYPNGYKIRLQGANRISGQKNHLIIKNESQANTVKMTISPI